MKILIYNWVQFDENDGGGVTVYLNNIINKLIENKDIEIYFLSSGTKYNIFSNKIKLKKTKNKHGDRVHTYTIYNSPVMFAYNQFSRIDIYNEDKKIVKIIDQFIEKHNGFDIIHFNNLEGLSLEVLSLKNKYPNTKFLYSMHNYFPICPNVNLWKHNCENCKDYHDGKDCCNCINSDYKFTKKVQKVKTLLFRLGIDLNSPFIKKCYIKFARRKKNTNVMVIDNTEKAGDYKKFREKNIKYINKYVDKVLCVSKRVLEIAVQTGIKKEKCCVSYIGTKFADKLERQKIDINSKDFNLIYLGYMNKMKGFEFLIKSLEKIDEKIVSKVNLTLVCRNSPDYNINEIVDKLEKKFKSVRYIDGYTHDNLKEILKGQHLGVIPVEWEDNLPQVAIETTAFGVPILCSDLGGASELCTDDDFKFKGSDTQDFINKLTNIINNRETLSNFWDSYNKPTTMEQHIKELYIHYGM